MFNTIIIFNSRCNKTKWKVVLLVKARRYFRVVPIKAKGAFLFLQFRQETCNRYFIHRVCYLIYNQLRQETKFATSLTRYEKSFAKNFGFFEVQTLEICFYVDEWIAWELNDIICEKTHRNMAPFSLSVIITPFKAQPTFSFYLGAKKAPQKALLTGIRI